MNVWIFQGNPAKFNINRYLAAADGRITWLVTRYKAQIVPGDTVYIWRSSGDQPAGIIAETRVASAVSPILPDEKSRPFWSDPDDQSVVADRVELDLIRVAGKRELLKRDWLAEDPVLESLHIIRQPAGTNFPVSPEQAIRLSQLWAKTGSAWTRPEVIAALWAYNETYGASISKKVGSPVATVSLKIGRVVGGVYNKLMNLRALDPRARDQGKAGLSGGGATDKIVFDEFFDRVSGEIRRTELEKAYLSNWDNNSGEIDVERLREATEREAIRLEARSLDSLLATYHRRVADRRDAHPPLRHGTSVQYERDPYVIAIARSRAKFVCEVPGCAAPTFITESGGTYTEVHHLTPLSEGGVDSIENVACVCPLHHRELHFGVHRSKLTDMLRTLRQSDS